MFVILLKFVILVWPTPSDLFNDRVMKWSKGASEGVVVTGEHGEGNSLKQLNDPRRLVEYMKLVMFM